MKLLRPQSPSFKVSFRLNQGFKFTLPALLMLLLVLGFPIAVAVLTSFTAPTADIGNWSLENYWKLTKDSRFSNSLLVTFTFVGGTVLLHLLLGFTVALVLNAQIKALAA